MQRVMSVMGNVAKHILGSIERAIRAMAITGLIVALLVGLGTEATGYLLTHEINGPTHLAAAALAIAFGYAAAVTVAIGEILRGIIKGIEMIVEESEHLAQEGLHEAEVIAQRAEVDALHLGRAALGDAGSLGRGIVGGAEGLEHRVTSHVPGHHPDAQAPSSTPLSTTDPRQTAR
jgi:hypothetical protein